MKNNPREVIKPNKKQAVELIKKIKKVLNNIDPELVRRYDCIIDIKSKDGTLLKVLPTKSGYYVDVNKELIDFNKRPAIEVYQILNSALFAARTLIRDNCLDDQSFRYSREFDFILYNYKILNSIWHI